jgi:hypothetical protein
VKTEKIYLASSWRNVYQPELITVLRSNGFEVYDFRNPQTGGPSTFHGYHVLAQGFSWRQVDPHWGLNREDLLRRYKTMLEHPVAQEGFAADFNAMKWADTCVIALPSGRSAHLECGWMAGAGKKIVVYMPPATKTCEECQGGGWVAGNDFMRNDCCTPCDGTGRQFIWNFEPELMYMIGGSPEEVLAFSHDEMLERLRA